MTQKNKIVKCMMIVAFITFFSLSINRVNAHQIINYYGIHMTTDEYMTLLNLGFTDDEIYYMDEDIFNENKNLDATLVAQSNKYYKVVTPMYGQSYVVEVSPSEALNQPENNTLGYVTTQYINEVSTISANGSKYRYKNTVNWLNIPENKSFDVIAIGFINSVFIDSNVYFRFSYADSSGTWHNSTLYYDKKNTSTGGSTTYKIPTTLYGLSALLYFDVSKNTTDTLTNLTMCGDYAHSLESIGQLSAANHAVNSGGIQFSSSVYDYFNEIPCATAMTSVNW